MPGKSRDRHRQFRAALALSGQSVAGFAAQIGIHTTHLYLVVKGERASRRVESSVDALIATHLPQGIAPVPMPHD